MKKILFFFIAILLTSSAWAGAGKCLYFQGGQYATLGTGTNIRPSSGEVYIGMWVKRSNWGTTLSTAQTLITTSSTSTGLFSDGYMAYLHGTSLFFTGSLIDTDFGAHTTYKTFTASTDIRSLDNNVWHYLTFSISPTSISVSVDGIITSTSFVNFSYWNAGINYQSTESYLGRNQLNGEYLSNTYLDELKINSGNSLNFQFYSSQWGQRPLSMFHFEEAGTSVTNSGTGGGTAALSSDFHANANTGCPFNNTAIWTYFNYWNTGLTPVTTGILSITPSSSLNNNYIQTTSTGENALNYTDLPTDVTQRLEVIWAVEAYAASGSVPSVQFTFTSPALKATTADKYVLLYRTGTSGNFSIATTGTISVSGSNVFVSGVDLPESSSGTITYYTLGRKADLPAVTTAAITNKTASSASGGGDITNDGTATVTTEGVCWNTTGTPTTSDSYTTDSGNPFTSTLSSLQGNTNYYVRAYATNSAGTSYGQQVTFTTPYATPTSQAVINTVTLNPTSIVINWTKPNDAQNVAVFVRKPTGTGSYPTLVDGAAYTAYTTFGNGLEITGTGFSGWYCVYNGSGSSVTVTKLSPETTYQVYAAAYNGGTGAQYYNQTTVAENLPDLANPCSALTTSYASSQAYNISASTTGFTLSWLRGQGDASYVFMKKITASNLADRTDTLTIDDFYDNGDHLTGKLISYTPSTTYGTGGAAIGDGWYCVFSDASATSTSVTFPATGDLYRVQVIMKTGTDYNFATADANPVCLANKLSQSSPGDVTETSVTVKWIKIIGADGYLVEVSKLSSFSTLVIPTVNITDEELEQYEVTGLNTGEQYWFRLRAYSGDMESPNSTSYQCATLPNITYAGYWTNTVGPNTNDAFNVTIQNNYTTPLSFLAGDLLVKSGATLTIPENLYVRVNGSLVVEDGGHIVVKSSSAGDGALVAYGTTSYNGSEAVTVERYISRGSWHDVSTPVTSWMLDYFKGCVVYSWADYTKVWTLKKGTGFTMAAKDGYRINYTKSRDTVMPFKGTPHSGTQAFNLPSPPSPYVPASNTDVVFTGNPYPCAMDWEATGWTRTNLSAAFYVYASGGKYMSYNHSTNVSTNGGTQYIPIGQGFFVQLTNTSLSPVLTAAATVQSTNTSTKLKASSESESYISRLSVDGMGITDEYVVYFGADGLTNEYEFSDTRKFLNDTLNIYTIVQDKKIAVNSVAYEENELSNDLRVLTKKNGSYSLHFSGDSVVNDKYLVLDDLNKGVTLRASQIEGYQFTLNKGDTLNLRLRQMEKVITPEVVNEFLPFTIIYDQDKVYLNNRHDGDVVTVTDLLGHQIARLSNNERIFETEKYKNSILLFNYQDERSAVTKKVLIR